MPTIPVFSTHRFTDIDAAHLQVSLTQRRLSNSELHDVMAFEVFIPGIDSVSIDLSRAAAERLAHYILETFELVATDDKEPPI